MPNELTTAQKALILLDDDSPALYPAFSAVSSDITVATVGDGGDYKLAVIAQGAGTTTITVTRALDNETADMEVTVTAAAPFTVHLGAPTPK